MSSPSDQLALPLHASTWDLGAAMWLRAGGRCEICGLPERESSRGRLHVDHDHRLGTGWDHIRGLLCHRCNNHMKYVDNGHWKPTEAQRRYVENAWFWVLLPPEQRDEPFFPEKCYDPTQTYPYELTPTNRRRVAAMKKAKAAKRRLRRTRAGTICWWDTYDWPEPLHK